MKQMGIWEPPVYWHGPLWLCWVGVWGLWAYAACLIAWPGLGKSGELITALLGLLAVLVFGKGVRGSAALWLLLAAVAVQSLSWTLGYFHHSEWITDNPQLDRLAKLFIFIGVAWWLGGSTHNTLLIWGLALIGLFAATFILGEGISEWFRGVQGRRVDFSIRNAQHTAMFFGTALLGLVAFSKRCIYSDRLVLWRLALWLLALVVCVTGVLITQTRAIWLALVIALPVMGLVWGIRYFLSRRRVSLVKPLALTIITVLFIALGVGTFFYDAVNKRLEAESNTIDFILQGELDDVPYTSIGIRLHSWRAAAEWIMERPLVGWGEKGRSLVIEHTPWLPKEIKQEYGHLHNSFLEIWVGYGLLGLTLFGVLGFWVARGVWLSWLGGVLPNDMALFAICFFVYWVVVNQFEAYISFWTGVYIHNLILGGLVTHYWHWKFMQKQPMEGY